MRAYYSADRTKFYSDSDSEILGQLTLWHHHDLVVDQRGAWMQQIHILRHALENLPDFTVWFEFLIPRMAKRADVVLVVGDCVFVIEFKVNGTAFDRHAIEQVEDYALDLKNFHAGSHHLSIVPILVPTLAPASRDVQLEMALGQVERPLLLAVRDLGETIRVIAARHAARLDAAAWAASGYRPTPTIVEAAQALYAQHDVKDIARSDADAINLGRTQDAIAEVILAARAGWLKSVCFITGVPGAGKTLAGLNIATQRSDVHADDHACFLSGNDPLVDVLRAALARDQHKRLGGTFSHIDRKVRAFIHNIRIFRDEYVRKSDAPAEHVVVFDEAQRAWTRAKASSFMQRKRNVPGFDMSEPEFLLSVMDRHRDWCTVICLVGGGQEINTGEAGLSEWMAAIRDRFPHWRVYASDQIVQPDYSLNDDAQGFIRREQVSLLPELHLGVSMRSFRAETLSDFISHVLNGDAEQARAAVAKLDQYPLKLTRDLDTARAWLRAVARGTERYGLVASSGAMRLRPEGLHLKAGIDPPKWFLNDRTDVRSSFYLEDVASEFDVQGLELDWTGVCWDADWRFDGERWQAWDFKGTKWQKVRQTMSQHYLKNAYRVILTRARQGLVVFMPRGDADDPTRPPVFYDGTYEYLLSCGFTPLEETAKLAPEIASGGTLL